MEHLKGLNNEQKEAAIHKDGPLLVLAGAGAGKTKTITHRIVNLIKQGVSPDRILAVTFTNKAAKEMKERIETAIKSDFVLKSIAQADEPSIVIRQQANIRGFQNKSAFYPFVSTFHSLGVHIIKENAKLLGLTKHFSILDESDANSIIKDIIKELGLDPKQYEPRKIKNAISREKGKFKNISDFVVNENEPYQNLVAQVWALYETRKNKENSLDFDDLLLKSTKLLKENKEIREYYQNKWEYIHVDEYQDTNEVQYVLSKLLAEKNKNICVVGDTDQCLLEGTKIKMANGTQKNIEKIKKGDFVLSNFGSGDFREAKVLKKRTLKFKGDLIQIKTLGGKIIKSTPEHIHFAGYKPGTTPQLFLNYLMYKNNVGWRIGTTSIYTKSKKKAVVGFIQRSNQEHADALWVIATHKTQKDARIQEYLFSLKYQIPTVPFTPRKGLSINGYVHDSNSLKQIFSSFKNENFGLKLLEDLNLSMEYPHHRPQTRNSNRRNINITLCADKRGKNPMHLISIFGNDQIGRKKLENLGFSVRKAKKNTKNWRFETVRANYGEVCLLAMEIFSVFENANLIFSARLGGVKSNPRDHNSLYHFPASSLMPGMALFTENGYDTISQISKITVNNKNVFDLDIEKTHNFLANGIVTHNCIYSWRGANLKNILNFEKDYPQAKIILLEENYRSTKNILEAANEVIKKNQFRPDKNLFTKNKTGEKISLYEALDESDEAEFIATKILEILDGATDISFVGSLSPRARPALPLGPSACETPREEKSVAPSDIAVLYRANFQSRVLEEAMLRYNIPYQVLGVKFFERKEIKDTLAYLRAALNPESLSDIKRIINFPARGIGKTTIAKIFSGDKNSLPIKTKIKIDSFYKLLEDIKEITKNKKAYEIIKFVIKKTGIENELQDGTDEGIERLDNIKELATLALKYDDLPGENGIEKLLEDASLASDQDSILIGENKKENKNAVKLMTVHAAKGLEFKYVFVAGLEQGLFPYERQGEIPEDAEEERRLFYVALTRAREKLFLSFTDFRTIFGSRQINTPSEFISDIPSDILEKEGGDKNIKTIYI